MLRWPPAVAVLLRPFGSLRPYMAPIVLPDHAGGIVRVRRVLFFAEAVTLAHVARPMALAQGLAPAAYETVIACHSRYRSFLEDGPWESAPLASISSQQFLRALARGSPLYDATTLREYVSEDLKLIERVKPDLIVGDFRLSLSVSARLARVPYAAISNAYWSPYYARHGFPLPVLPMTRFLPLPLASLLFQAARPLAFGLHCQPLNRVRREHGLPSLGNDLRRVYTDADDTLYADNERMFPTALRPQNHRYLGPIVWSPPVPLPHWWHELPTNSPVIYVTMGSSGDSALTHRVLEALAELPVTIMASMAGAAAPARLPANVFTSDYLPGIQAAARSKLVICNGGSPTSHQALAAGVPVLGIAGNMDQFLNMRAITEARAGRVIRADRMRPGKLREYAVALLWGTPKQHIAELAGEHDAAIAPQRFAAFVAASTVGTP